MNDKFKETEEFNDDNIIEMTDEDGNIHYFYEEMKFMAQGAQYAVLSFFNTDEDDSDGSEAVFHENDTTIAKVIKNKAGEDEYLTPTDEEFTAAVEVYEKMEESDFE